MTSDYQASQPIAERNEAPAKQARSNSEFKLEQQLHQTEAALLWYRRWYDITPHFYFTTNPQGTLLSINRSAAEQLDYTAQELVGTSIFSLFHPDDRAVLSTALTTSNLSLQNDYRIERLCRKNGSILWVKITAHQFDPDTILLSCEEVTQYKQTEAALQKSNAHIANILENISDGFFVLDHQWQFTYLNSHAEHLLQRTQKDLLGKNVWHEYPAAVGSLFEQEYRRAMLEQVAVTFEEFYLPSNSWYEVHAYPSQDGLSVYFRDITERKQTQEALQNSQQQLQALFDNALDAILVADDDGRYVDANPAACELLGSSKEALVGVSITEFANAESRADVQLAWQTFLEQGKQEGEFQLYRADRTTRSLEFRAKANCLPGLHLSVLRDVTKRKQAQEALRVSEERFRSLSACSPVGIFLTDTQGNCTYNNPRWQAISGFTFEEALGTGWADAIHPDDRLQVMANWDVYTERGQDYFGEFRLQHPDGGVRWVCVRSSPMFSDENDLIGYVSTVEDITERKQAAAALQESKALLQAILDYSPTVIYLKDGQGRYILVNRQYETLIGVTQQQIMGKTDYDIFPKAMADVYHANDRKVLEARTALIFEEDAPIDDQIRTYLEGKFPLFDVDGNLYAICGIATDITDRKQAASAIQQLNQTLENRVLQLQSANQELDSFSYSVSHDLRAPLRAMHGFSRVLVERYSTNLPTQAQHYIQRIHHNAWRMGELIDDLLTFSRLSRQPLSQQSIDPTTIVRQAIADLRDQQDNRQVEITIGQLAPCSADPALLKQVWMNLLTNALKFTSKQAVAQIEIGCQPSDGNAIYFIRDNGVGFEMQYAHKLFGVFQRLHSAEEFEGTGVGLAIVQRIVHRHGGLIWVEAAVDRGAAFYFTLALKDVLSD